MSRINSRAKGARAERAWCLYLKEIGFNADGSPMFDAKRGCQNAGRDQFGQDFPDVVCPSLAWIHWEVKAVERLNIHDATSQAERDSDGTGKVPIVAHKKNNSPWLITMPADEFAKFLRGDLPPEI